MAGGKGRHRLTEADLLKRTGDRRRMALAALLGAARQHEESKRKHAAKNPEKVVEPTLTPVELAEAWKIHPTSAYRVLERLRGGRDRAGHKAQGEAVTRTGSGLDAEYQITEDGVKKLAWLERRAEVLRQMGSKRGARK